MTEYTPTTNVVRNYWVAQGVKSASKRAKRGAEFDRWLAGHNREAKAEAWDEGFMNGYLKAIGGNEKENPYRDI